MSFTNYDLRCQTIHRPARALSERVNRNSQIVNHYTESAAMILMFSTPTREVGLLCSPLFDDVTGVSPMARSTSSPLISWPNAVYCRSRNFASARQMKNWLPAETGCYERAIETTPRTCERSLNSAF